MWSRKRFDIEWCDLIYAVARCLARVPQSESGGLRSTDRGELVCLSARSGLDLVLAAAAFPRGSEVLVSAMTIPDIVRIIRQHGLVPIPLDLDAETAFPPAAQLTRRVTSRTKAVLLAHLFGATMPLDEHLAVARRHNLLFIEDCAQAFRGLASTGHSGADVSLFSFGPIKTATALGGAVMRVRNGELLAEIRRRHSSWAMQSRAAYCRRVIKYMVLKALSCRVPLAWLIMSLRLFGRDYDKILNSSVTGFASDRLFELIRRRPCAALVDLLWRRLERFDARVQRHRAERGRRLAEALRHAFVCPAAYVSPHAYWVFPILTDSPNELRLELFRHRFDATQGHSMVVVDPPPGRDDLEPRETRRFLANPVPTVLRRPARR